MQTVTFASLIVLAGLLLISTPKTADAVCCLPQWKKGLVNCCPDGSSGTPYCGVGSCNFFGCNCDGGCRAGERKRQEDEMSEMDNALSILSNWDLNGDGVLSADELKTILQQEPYKNGTCPAAGARTPTPKKDKN